jgi:hypothetical protein
VVTLVEHDQAEPRPQVLHVQVGRIVGGDRQGPDAVFSAADDADFRVEARPEKIEPLPDQIQSGRDHERAAFSICDRHDRYVALAGAGGQHDHATAASTEPRPQRLALKGTRLAVRAQPGVELRVGARPVLELMAGAQQGPNQIGVRHRGRTHTARPRVPHAGVRQLGLRWIHAAKLERARDEGQSRHAAP